MKIQAQPTKPAATQQSTQSTSITVPQTGTTDADALQLHEHAGAGEA